MSFSLHSSKPSDSQNLPYSPSFSPTSPLHHPRTRRLRPSSESRFSPRAKSSPYPCSPSFGDRFIPNRSSLNVDLSDYTLNYEMAKNSNACDTTPGKEQYKALLANAIFHGKVKDGSPSKILSFSNVETPSNRGLWKAGECPLRVLFEGRDGSSNALLQAASNSSRYYRAIPSNPEKILDAPHLVDDYYLNLLDWNVNNVVCIALSSTVYLWNASTGESSELMHTGDENNIVTSLSFSKQGNILAIGTNDSQVQIWDIERKALLRTMLGHSSRVGSLDWNGYLLSSGSRDSLIFNHDVRISDHIVQTLEKHSQEVCGLKWSLDGTQLASGGNDNTLNIWRLNQLEPQFTFDHHTAAVKALAWCPFQSNLLSSGGGTADRHIRFWNTSNGSCINSVDTKSQVCAVIWSRHSKELISSHGYSQNQLIVWKYPSMQKLSELKGHSSRVLHLAQSPDGTTIASAAGDETLRFWKVFEPKNDIDKKNSNSFSSGFLRGLNIR
jgi:cell division cycle protein 20 (cofactor of APC complex)